MSVVFGSPNQAIKKPSGSRHGEPRESRMSDHGHESLKAFLQSGLVVVPLIIYEGRIAKSMSIKKI